MNKKTIEISREKDFPIGYGKVSYLNENSEEILNKLMDWSQEWENLEKKIYKHKIKYLEENHSDRVYKYFYCGRIIEKEEYDELLKNPENCLAKPYQVNYCDLVCYLDIYYQ